MLKGFFFIISTLLFQYSAKAQKNFKIKYGWYNYKLTDTDFELKKKKYLIGKDYLFINGDGLSFYSKSDKITGGTVKKIGEKPVHHGIYTFPVLSRSLSVNAWVRPYDLKEYETYSYNWEILHETRLINGYSCKLAVSEDLKAWFCEDIKIPIGPAYYNGLPGLILRVEDHKRYRLYEAISVEETDVKIVLPDLKLIACADCESKLEEIKKYSFN